jgi:signal peptidase II
MNRIRAPRAAIILSVAALVGCDRVTKDAAATVLRDRAPIPIVQGGLELTYAENRDIAFNLLSRLSLHFPAWALTAFTLLATIALVIGWAHRRHRTRVGQVGAALVFAGATGNALDRILRGYVVDFIHVQCWPVFNVADALIVGGLALVVLARSPTREYVPG